MKLLFSKTMLYLMVFILNIYGLIFVNHYGLIYFCAEFQCTDSQLPRLLM